MDRAVAERAGIGFAGKHASLITREAGSYVLLAEMLLSVPLPADAPSHRGCGHRVDSSSRVWPSRHARRAVIARRPSPEC